MTDPANDPAGPPNYDADRQQNTAADPETTDAPEGLPWELNPAVERPVGNYETLAEANEAQGITTSSVDDTPAVAANDPAATAPANRPAEASTQNAPVSSPQTGTVTGSETATDAPIDESGTAAPTARSETVGDITDGTTTKAETGKADDNPTTDPDNTSTTSDKPRAEYESDS